MKILADASIPLLQELYKQPFFLTRYQQNKEVKSLIGGHDILICRSTLAVNEDLLRDTNIQCVATASSGIDHIDTHYLLDHHIELIDAKGSNACAVADYVMATIAFLEKNSQLKRGKACVVGVGCVGSQVMSRLQWLGFDVIGYDPLKEHDSVVVSADFSEIFSCDLICIHANLHSSSPFPSFNLFNDDNLRLFKPNVVIINASRGDIVNEKALLSMKQPINYCTDVYSKEPAICPELVDFSRLCTPHIAGHSIEAKRRASIQLSKVLHQRYHVSREPLPAETDLLAVHGKSRIELSKPTWQEMVLSIYNPWHETQLLKQACDKQTAFLKIRKAHQHRHDFDFIM